MLTSFYKMRPANQVTPSIFKDFTQAHNLTMHHFDYFTNRPIVFFVSFKVHNGQQR